ncbi:hypothetical protein EP1X_04755 [Thermococcus sp. EP1]|uniref:hypothetical protein n=1 Tax=Thermococcus sp. EP1 TaxID=1591054 RepID=UPI0006DA8D2A|nr:hypothetical protein [Thermococcus sp. EP1]KPU63100.1 hypothetical protein EP1X_04755 [Thermococcus sp. EP1]
MVYVIVREEIVNGKLKKLTLLIGDKEQLNNFIYEELNKFYKEGGSFSKRKETEDRLYEVWELRKSTGEIIELRFYVFGNEDTDVIEMVS